MTSDPAKRLILSTYEWIAIVVLIAGANTANLINQYNLASSLKDENRQQIRKLDERIDALEKVNNQ